MNAPTPPPEAHGHRANGLGAHRDEPETEASSPVYEEAEPLNDDGDDDTAPSQKRPETIKDVERVKQLWTECRERYGAGGPFLFGAFSIADAFYAPVVSRFRSYAIPVDGAVKAYAEMIWATPAMQRWYADAQAETLRAAKHE